MLRYLPHIFTIWFGSDFIIIGFVIYGLVICIIDLKYEVCRRFLERISSKASSVDVIFCHLLGILATIIVLDMKYNYMNFGIVDYVDARATILRNYVVWTSHVIYIAGGLIAAVCLAVKASSRKIRWFAYGLFFNFLAVLYFIRLNRK